MPTQAEINLLADDRMQSSSLSTDADQSHLQFSDIVVKNALGLCDGHCIFALLGSLDLLWHVF